MARGDDKEKKPFYEEIADRLIKQLEEGTAPWQNHGNRVQTECRITRLAVLVTKGANALWLAMQQRTDPRWMTYKQAQSVNAQVQKGEKVRWFNTGSLPTQSPSSTIKGNRYWMITVRKNDYRET